MTKKAGYTSLLNMKETPQAEPIIGKKMVKNDANGYSFQVTDETRLERFLIMGTTAPTYYATAKTLTKDSVDFITKYVEKNPMYVVNKIVEISDEGRAPKNDHALYALALCASSSSDTAKAAAFDALPKVARTGTHLFQFISYVDTMRGWGDSLKKGINKWYNSKDVRSLAYQLIKYKNREGWTHRDVFRKTHIVHSPFDNERTALYRYVVKGETMSNVSNDKSLALIRIDSEIQNMNKNEIIDCILKYNIPREIIPTKFLKDADIWNAMLVAGMPMTAMIRNLRNMINYGVLAPFSNGEKLIIDSLNDKDKIQKSRIHPLQVFQASKMIENTSMSKSFSKAMNNAFLNSFKNVVPSGKRFLCSFDISGSMYGSPVNGFEGLNAAEASAIMGMATQKSEEKVVSMAFTTDYTHLNPSVFDTYKSAYRKFRELSGRMGGTDCAQPMLYALKNKIPIDVFVVYTDSETWAGSIHPMQALKKYRNAMDLNSKLIVSAMSVNNFTIADPSDVGCLDICGFDSSAPMIISNFVSA